LIEPAFLRNHRISAEHGHVLTELQLVLDRVYDPAVSMIVQCLAKGGKVMTCGSRASQLLAMYFTSQLCVRFMRDRRALSCITLSTNLEMISSIAEDFGYPKIYARQVEANGRAEDCLVAFSASPGHDASMNEVILVARNKGLSTLALSGHKGLVSGPDVDIIVPSNSPQRIMELHFLIAHLLLEGIDKEIPD
jgi:D-sedoheptulose 7-phosphate isomerase